jgi:hypothetical protein
MQQGKYVRDLKQWELPRLEQVENQLIDQLASEARAVLVKSKASREEVYTLCVDRFRELAATAVNEVIEYWLKGLVDGNDGRFPQVCVEFPYLERDENTEALTVAYCVDNEDGTRTELNRATLEAAVMRVLEGSTPEQTMRRAKVVACELRALAAKIESALAVRRD